MRKLSRYFGELDLGLASESNVGPRLVEPDTIGAPWRPSARAFSADGKIQPDDAPQDALTPPVQQINEPSDQIPGNASTPFTLAIGGSQTGVVNVVGDDDWFRVDLVAGQSYVFT